MPERVHDVKLGDVVSDDDVAYSGRNVQSQASSGSRRKSAILNRSGESHDVKTGIPFGSKGSLCFVAIAMAGLASVGARGGKWSRDHYSLSINNMNDPPRFNIFSCGKQLNRSLTIYQVIQRQAVADEDDDERYTGSYYALANG